MVCDGFYEWQTTKNTKTKQPYFIYVPQPDGVKIEDPKTWDTVFDEENGWRGPRLLQMAALFDKWTSPEGDEIYSYTIITLESNETLSWLHHRMPAILDSDEELSSWLDYGEVNAENALKYVKPVKVLLYHSVSTLVNNSRNKDPKCNMPANQDVAETKPSKSADFMKSWLSGSKRSNQIKDESPSKVCKKED